VFILRQGLTMMSEQVVRDVQGIFGLENLLSVALSEWKKDTAPLLSSSHFGSNPAAAASQELRIPSGWPSDNALDR